MDPTLQNGDRIIIDKISYEIQDIEKDDIIVFDNPNHEPYIKRVIGLPGDSISIREDQLYINNFPHEEKYMNNNPRQIDFELEELNGVDHVPKGYVFVLGDNRTNSVDSRTLGFISKDDIIGKAQSRIYPFNRIDISVS